jgi:hypothetical protein
MQGVRDNLGRQTQNYFLANRRLGPLVQEGIDKLVLAV